MATVAEAFAEAVKHHMSGSVAHAEQIYDQIIAADPSHADALNLRGVLAYQTGNLEPALQFVRRAVELNRANVGYLNNLGVILAATGQIGEAAACYRQALELAPDFADAHANLGNALKSQGKIEEAIASYRQALSYKPDHADAHNNLGNTLMELRRLDEAVSCFREAVRHRPAFAQAHSNLGTALREQSRLVEAAAAYRLALHYQPDLVEVHVNLGCTLRDKGKLDEAIAAHRQAIVLNPRYAEAHNSLGNALYDQGRIEEALACFREAARLKPDYPEAHYNLGTTLRDLGEFDSAITHFKEAVRCKPTLSHALYNLGQLAARGHYRFSTSELESLNALLDPAQPASSSLAAIDRSLLHYTLADLMDGQDRCDDAFEHYRQANELRRQASRQKGRAFVPQKHGDQVERIIQAFTREYFERVHSFGLDSEMPVFVVGMPRSGTTLVEQILCSHPQVLGAGELRDIPKLAENAGKLLKIQEKFPASMAYLDSQTAQALAQRYLERITQLSRQASAARQEPDTPGPAIEGSPLARVVDKLPRNRRYLGFICTLFPRARIIHCRRDALDTCLSLYFQHFEHLSFSTSLEEIALMYGLYEKVMAHWSQVLPVPMFEVQYERLVEEQEKLSRELIAFCGLAWDDRCLAFHKTRRPVQTASTLQVRQPIYRSSIGRWKRYETHLQPLISALASAGVRLPPNL